MENYTKKVWSFVFLFYIQYNWIVEVCPEHILK